VINVLSGIFEVKFLKIWNRGWCDRHLRTTINSL